MSVDKIPENYYDLDWWSAINILRKIRSWTHKTTYKYINDCTGNVNSSKGMAIKLIKMLFIVKNTRDKRTWKELNNYNPDLTTICVKDISTHAVELIKYLNNHNGYGIKSVNDLFKLASALLDPLGSKEQKNIELFNVQMKKQCKLRKHKAKNSIKNNPNSITYEELNKCRDYFGKLLKGLNISKLLKDKEYIFEPHIVELYQTYLVLCIYCEHKSIKPPRITELSLTQLITKQKYEKLSEELLKNNCYLVTFRSKFIYPTTIKHKLEYKKIYSQLLHFGKLARKGINEINENKDNTIQYIKSKFINDVFVVWKKILSNFYKHHFNSKPTNLFIKFDWDNNNNKPTLKEFTGEDIRKIMNYATVSVLYKKVNPTDVRKMKEELIKLLLHKVKQELQDMGHSMQVALNTYADELTLQEVVSLEHMEI